MTERTVFIISDHTGLTAEAVARSLLAQFESVAFHYETRPFTTTNEHLQSILGDMEVVFKHQGNRPIVFSTLANPKLVEQLDEAPGLHFDLFRSYLGQLQTELGQRPTGRVGSYHSINNVGAYFSRINAIDFTLATDDGLGDKHYQSADVILAGVSRVGKTPTCLFLALHYGIHAANYPLAESDFERERLTERLKPFQEKLVALTIDPKRLQQIRQQRRPDSTYSSLSQCEYEIRQAERLFQAAQLHVFDTTAASIEEIATNIIKTLGLSRRTT